MLLYKDSLSDSVIILMKNVSMLKSSSTTSKNHKTLELTCKRYNLIDYHPSILCFTITSNDLNTFHFRNMRGGRVVFQNVTKPNTDDWESALSAVEASLELEKSVHESILAMHKNADEQGDAQLTDFLEGEYLKEQVH